MLGKEQPTQSENLDKPEACPTWLKPVHVLTVCYYDIKCASESCFSAC